MAGLQILQADMAKSLVDHGHLLLIPECGLFLQVWSGVLLQEDLREVHQPDVAVLGHLMPHPLLKERSLSVQGLLDLALSHPRLWRPGHLLPDLPAVDIIPVGYDDPVTIPSLFNCGHNLLNRPFHSCHPAFPVVEWKGRVGRLVFAQSWNLLS